MRACWLNDILSVFEENSAALWHSVAWSVRWLELTCQMDGVLDDTCVAKVFIEQHF